MKADVVDTGNKKVDQIDLEDSVFAAEVKPWLFYEVVKMQLACRRAGTQSTKTITEVSGTGAKPHRQKGTGRARQGSNRSAHMRGGAVVLGPKPRDYSYKLPKKMIQGAMRSALSLRQRDSALTVVRGWAPEAPKTKAAKSVLEAIGAGRALVIGNRDEQNLRLSLRNLPHVDFLPVEGINLYDVLKHDHLVLSESAAAELSQRFKTVAKEQSDD